MWGAIIAGAASVAGSLMSKKSSDKASSQAEQANEASLQMQREQLEFEKERYADWKAIYGPIQENLGNYYQNLSPEYYEAMGLEAFELERTNAMSRLDETLAQRGVTDSGLSASLRSDMAMQSATQRAQIRRQAPVQARQEQQDFLSLGMRADPAPSVSSALAQRSSFGQQSAMAAQGRAQQASMAAGQAFGSAVSTIGSGLSSYLDKNYSIGGSK
ncbi:hypothetical protein ETP1_038 [Edwardsiella phage ETP-1]|uniref:Uncharacterized protein n=1 Tax=Edwardsiella phage ETP-1 TaxID=2544920 RepID=A0A6G5P4L8_9CAUD|nr:hypothetical protein ETP1_038 [Edwardsiella phage ETP-1]